MKKNRIILTAVCVFLFLGLCSCGGSDVKESSVEEAAAITAEQIIEKLDSEGRGEILDARAVLGEDIFDESCEKLYGVPAGKLSDGGIMYVSSGASADEVSVIASADGSVDCEQILNDRIVARQKDFEGYKPDEIDKIKAAEVFSCGDVWVLVISDDGDKIKSDILKIGQ